METAVQTLLFDFVHEAQPQNAGKDLDHPLRHLVEESPEDSAVCKRDLRRLLEKDPGGFLQSACRILRVSADKSGVGPLLELLWSSSLMLASLIDPVLLSLPAATSLAKRWVEFDPMLDIKLLQIAFPMSNDEEAAATVEMARPKRALDVVSELPPNRHVLLALAKLLRFPDAQVRSKAALLYARACKNPEWVRKMLGEPDARVRANAVEGLWETKSPFAVALFREAALDPDHRVAANALIGLHYCGEPEGVVADVLETMARDSSPQARRAAAFAIGKIMAAGCTAILENLLRDHDPAVRGQALRSLIQVRRQDRGATTPAPLEMAPLEPGGQSPVSNPGVTG